MKIHAHFIFALLKFWQFDFSFFFLRKKKSFHKTSNPNKVYFPSTCMKKIKTPICVNQSVKWRKQWMSQWSSSIATLKDGAIQRLVASFQDRQTDRHHIKHANSPNMESCTLRESGETGLLLLFCCGGLCCFREKSPFAVALVPLSSGWTPSEAST